MVEENNVKLKYANNVTQLNSGTITAWADVYSVTQLQSGMMPADKVTELHLGMMMFAYSQLKIS